MEMKNGVVYIKTEDGEYEKLGEVKKIEESDLKNEPYDPFDVNAWDDEITISFKMSWWQRLKFKFLLWKAMRKEKRKRK